LQNTLKNLIYAGAYAYGRRQGNTLKNPIYAGAYAYGRRQGVPVKGSASGSRIQTMAMEDWNVLIQDQVPAYIKSG